MSDLELRRKIERIVLRFLQERHVSTLKGCIKISSGGAPGGTLVAVDRLAEAIADELQQ